MPLVWCMSTFLIKPDLVFNNNSIYYYYVIIKLECFLCLSTITYLYSGCCLFLLHIPGNEHFYAAQKFASQLWGFRYDPTGWQQHQVSITIAFDQPMAHERNLIVENCLEISVSVLGWQTSSVAQFNTIIWLLCICSKVQPCYMPFLSSFYQSQRP